jgi:hypothetical protein
MATGGGKTTVMAMTAAWSILNKLQDRANATYSEWCWWPRRRGAGWRR